VWPYIYVLNKAGGTQTSQAGCVGENFSLKTVLLDPHSKEEEGEEEKDWERVF
jgi:hypothetical protein